MRSFLIEKATRWEYMTLPPDNFKEGDSFDIRIETLDDGEVSDQYHSMHELYQHRMALNAALFHAWHKDYISYPTGIFNIEVMKSLLHNDGTMFDGYFIVMAVTEYGQISYHYKLKHWDVFNIPEVGRTPQWDGHNSLQVMERLLKL